MSPAFADDKACCSGGAMETSKTSCVSLASLGLNADQQAKLTAWQNECVEAGCTQESRGAFLKKAKTILSRKQYTQLKSECDKSMTKKS